MTFIIKVTNINNITEFNLIKQEKTYSRVGRHSHYNYEQIIQQATFLSEMNTKEIKNGNDRIAELKWDRYQEKGLASGLKSWITRSNFRRGLLHATMCPSLSTAQQANAKRLVRNIMCLKYNISDLAADSICPKCKKFKIEKTSKREERISSEVSISQEKPVSDETKLMNIIRESQLPIQMRTRSKVHSFAKPHKF